MIGATALFLGGCAASRPYLQAYTAQVPVAACSVAVLPIVNQSDYDQGGTILHRLLLSALLNERPWRLALEGDVRRIYRELHLRPWQQPTPDQIRVLGSRLEVDLLIGAKIITMEEQIKGGKLNPRLKIELQVYDGAEGTLLWSTYHSRKGTDYRKLMHFGLSNTVSELGKKMLKEILILWKEEGMSACPD